MDENTLSKQKAIQLCDRSIQRMLENYKQSKNPEWPKLIRKRIQLKKQILMSDRENYSRDEIGLAPPGWLIEQIGLIGGLIPRTNIYANGKRQNHHRTSKGALHSAA